MAGPLRAGHERCGLPFATGDRAGGARDPEGFRREIDSYSAFFENDRRTPTGLTGYLRERGLTRLFLAGLATDFCVHYSALDARRQGFAVVLIEDGCRAIDRDGSLAAALRAMAAAGVERMTSAAIAP